MISMKGRVSFSLELIDARLKQLRARPEPHDAETRREVNYLEDLRQRKFPNASPSQDTS